MTTWRMSFAFWKPKTTDTHSEYVNLIAFPLQKWLHERISILCYTYIVCLVCFKPCPMSVNISGLRVPILNLRDSLLIHFSSAAKRFHSATWATADYSGFGNFDIFRGEIIRLLQIVYSWFQNFAVFWIYYVFFWVVPRRLNYIYADVSEHSIWRRNR